MFSIRNRYPTPPPRPIRRPIRPRRVMLEGRANLALLSNSAAVAAGNEVETLLRVKGEQR